MNKVYGLALLAAVAAAPVVVEAQAPRAAAGQQQAERGGWHSPISRIVEHRAELGLTTEQVSRLQGIQQRLQQQNAPLMEQVRASGAWREGAAKADRGDRAPRADGARRGARAGRQVPEEMRPVMNQIRDNNRAAHQEVRSVLSDQQQVRLRELAQQQRAGGQRGEWRGNRGARGSR